MEYLRIILEIIGAVGIITLFTIRDIKRQKQAEAKMAEAKSGFAALETFEKRIFSYNVMIDDMDKKLIDSVKKYNDLQGKYDDLEMKYRKLSFDYMILKDKHDKTNKIITDETNG